MEAVTKTTFVTSPWKNKKTNQKGYITELEQQDKYDMSIIADILIITLDMWVHYQKRIASTQKEYSPEEYVQKQKQILNKLINVTFNSTSDKPQTDIITVVEKTNQ